MDRERSAAYPVLDLSSAYRILRQDLKEMGTSELGRTEIAKRLGYKTAAGGLAARKVGALVQYGLLDRRKGLYGLSPLGLELQRLDNEDPEFPSAIGVALEHPPLFKAILDRHRSSGRIPSTLAQDLAALGITERASADAARVFLDSALFAGVLGTDGVLRSETKGIILVEAKPRASSPQRTSEEAQYRIPLILPNEKQAWLILPRPMNLEDLSALKDSFSAAYKLLPKHLGLGAQQKPETAGDSSKTNLRVFGGKQRKK